MKKLIGYRIEQKIAGTLQEKSQNIRRNKFMEEMILQVLDCQIDGFICPNQADFAECDIHELFTTIYYLVDKGILRKRNCEGLAFEYNK